MFRHARVGEETRRRRCEMGNISLRDRDTVTAAERGREFWRGVLLAGGFTAVPRWTLDQVPGIAEHEAKICNEVVAALRRLADEVAVPLSSVLRPAHARVLGALWGEREVSTGYSFEGRSPLLCRFTTEPHSWRAMLLKADRAQSELLAHKDFPVDDLRREMGLIKPLFETVFSLTPGDGAELAEETVVWVGFVEQDGLVLRLRYRTDVLDADCAARIAGYHVTALALIAADPDAEHARQTLLSAEELHFQLHGLAGPRRKLPDCRAHELFEERARVHPDAIAAEHGNRRWTYRELNAHANQLARALLARGLSREGVVAVVTERNLDWIAAMLAIFKAGGAYLPIEPHFPADRIARTLSRAGCRLVLTERGSTTMLDQQEAVLDARRFIGKIVDGRVNVVQVVPSYLEVLLSYLAQYPCELPHLRCVSVTGEALKKELTQRWFAAQPGIKLVNAYGLTETSDDTNHEIMDSVPDRERVPLGPPINNVHVYVVDEHLSPAPLGAPGELVFAGVCVGRGYINDPERTRRAFLADPHRESQRLYRSGDYGRWLPEGKLEFLGRRDTQVKISGFRIEIGEIENTLLRLPGVREGAVVVTGGTDQSKHLVAFYAAQRPLDANALRDQFRESLPEYMVP